MAALEGAVALEEVDDVALAVGEDLHLDVAGVDDGLLQEDGGVTERGGGLAGRRLDGLAQRGRVLDAAHPTPAATGDRLHEQREADLLGGADEFVEVVGGGRGAEHRDTGRAGGGHGTGLVAGQFEGLRARPDERDAASSQAFASSGFSDRNP